MKPIKAKINVSKIKKEHLFKGEAGTYLDVVIWPNKDGGLDRFGNSHYIVQDLGKEARDRGERGDIIGNLKMPEGTQAPKKAVVKAEQPTVEDDSGVPF